MFWQIHLLPYIIPMVIWDGPFPFNHRCLLLKIRRAETPAALRTARNITGQCWFQGMRNRNYITSAPASGRPSDFSCECFRQKPTRSLGRNWRLRCDFQTNLEPQQLCEVALHHSAQWFTTSESSSQYMLCVCSNIFKMSNFTGIYLEWCSVRRSQFSENQIRK